MEERIRRLEEEARSTGEAFLPLLNSIGARIGISAVREGGSIILKMEVQVRLLSLSETVDLICLTKAVRVLFDLDEAGFVLSHYGDGWVVGYLPVLSSDVDAVSQRTSGTLKALDY